MKVHRLRESALQFFAVPALGILLILPLLFFYQVINNLIIIEERQLEALAREKLMLEAEAFQSDLNSEKFIENSLRKLNLKFGFSFPDNSFRNLSYPLGFDPELINAGFIASSISFLKEEFALTPALIIAADCDCRNSFTYFAPGVITDAEKQAKFVESAIISIATNETHVKSVLPDSPSIHKLGEESNARYGMSNPHLVFSENFHTNVSFFSNPPIYQDICERFFSNKFGNQRAYNYGYKIAKQLPGEFENIYGLYYMVFLGAKIEPQIVLKKALINRREGVKRLVIRKKFSRPYFQNSPEGLYYVSNLTSDFFQAINDSAKNNPGKEKAYKNFFRTHSISTFISNSELISSNRSFLAVLNFIAKLLMLIFFAASVFSFLRGSTLPIKLNWKLKLAVSIIVFIPIAGIFVTNKLINSASEKNELIKLQTRMKRQLRIFEQLDLENSLRTAYRFLLRKEIDAEHLANGIPDLEKIYQLQMANGNNGMGIFSVFLNKDGKAYPLAREMLIPSRNQRAEIIGLFRILNGLGFSNDQTPENKRIIREQYLYGSLGDSFWKVFASAGILAKENEEIHHIFSISPTKMALIQLLAPKWSPRKPFGVYFHELNDVRTAKAFLDFLQSITSLKFSETLENGSIDYAVFLRTNTNLRKFHLPREVAGLNRLKYLAEASLISRSSGTSSSRENGTLVLSSWAFREDASLIIVAEARLKDLNSENFFMEFIPWLLFFYGLLAVVLISNGLSSYFLQPVEVLIEGVSYINANKYDFKLEIDSQDEFSELSQSFNKMSQGLLQREKMKRFVSDKLLDSISADKNLSGDETRILDIAVLSSDIRSFTTISETYSPEEVVSLLNDYVTEMEKSIKANRGSIEKIVGDAIIASFSLESAEKNVLNACNAAISMKKGLETFNANRKQQNLFTIENGIGISFGPAIFGFAGGKARRKEFVIVGEVVKDSEELESLSKFGKISKIVVDQKVISLVEKDFRFEPMFVEGLNTRLWELADKC